MSSLHLISHHLCPYVQRAVIVLLEKEIVHERTYIDLAHKPDWFASASPLGKVPLLQTQGTTVFESQVIAEYLDEITPGSLHPADPLEKARHRAWIEFGSQTLATIAGFYNAPDEAQFDQIFTALCEKLQRVEVELEGPFFSGEEFHMIDAVWGAIFRYFDVFDALPTIDAFGKSPKLQKWRGLLASRPAIMQAVPEGYMGRLEIFLRNRNSYLATILPARAA